MARSRGSSSSARSAPRPAAPAAAPHPPPQQQQHHAPPPAPHHAAPAPAPAVGSSGPGFLGTIAQGMAFGAGSEVGHQAVRSMMGGGSSSHDAPKQEAAPAPMPPAPQMSPPASFNQQDACAFPQQDFMKCLQANNGDAAKCDFYFQALKQCQEGQRQNAQF